jgi:hypothetical protein
MTGPFDSAWLKWGRAVVHQQTLEAEITRFVAESDGTELTFGWHYDPKRHGFPVDIAAFDPWPAHWGPILGDVIANFRSALDHAAWAIVQRGRRGATGFPLGKPEARDVYFPVVRTDYRDFNREITKKLVGARRADVALVRRMQPYHRGKRGYRRHAIYILNELSKSDKHRSVQPVQMLAVEGSYTVLHARDCEPTTDRRRPGVRRVKMNVGAEVGVVRVRKLGSSPEVDVDVTIGLSPGITELARLDEWLKVTGSMIRSFLILLGSKPPDEIVQLGDPLLFFALEDLPPHLRP